MIAWILSVLFPIRPLRLHPIEDMKEILEYQNRITRTGNEPSGAIVGGQVVRQPDGKNVIVGEYIYPKRSRGSVGKALAIFPPTDKNALSAGWNEVRRYDSRPVAGAVR